MTHYDTDQPSNTSLLQEHEIDIHSFFTESPFVIMIEQNYCHEQSEYCTISGKCCKLKNPVRAYHILRLKL
jgi:hypothetical protein